ncbi:hypothetical protein ACH5RR_031608 [Cinchona calisaya]|uniref:Uncharacterized protein n=1 Tax=Cinchona calisaya TaxID=153742 RepID=A0ABD2YFR7_9GENT
MMRDLCSDKGREEEFIMILNFGGVKNPLLDSQSPTNTAFRLVIHMDDEVEGASKECSLQDNCQQLRSFLCLNPNSSFPGKEMIWPEGMVNLENSKSLRALKFEGYDFQEQRLPVELRKLISVRLLNVNKCKLAELPSSKASYHC